MSDKVVVFIDDKTKPANIPDYQTIITQCFKERPRQVTKTNISGVRLTLDKTSDNDVSDIWVKFGIGITMGEAKTQQFVSQYLQDSNEPAVRAPRVYLAFTQRYTGFIVSEFIDGEICTTSDTSLVVSAVQALINIPSPSSTPGPIGGGIIEHPFFFDRKSDIAYETVKDLQDHVNGILHVTGRKGHVRFSDKLDNHGLLLCVSDLKLVNFMKDDGDKIVAVDFGGYSFLPPTFFDFVLKYIYGSSNFALGISHRLQYPTSRSKNLEALISASCALVPYTDNDIGVPSRLKRKNNKLT